MCVCARAAVRARMRAWVTAGAQGLLPYLVRQVCACLCNLLLLLLLLEGEPKLSAAAAPLKQPARCCSAGPALRVGQAIRWEAVAACSSSD